MTEEWREPTVSDGDRLPWLETAEQDEREGMPLVRVVLAILLALAVILAAIFGVSWYNRHHAVDGNGALIEAQDGEYKVKPDDPGGMNVTGEGDTAIATSDGTGGGNSAINLRAVPEAPVEGKKAAAPAVQGGANKTVAAVPASGGKLGAHPVATPVSASAASGGSLVQIGSFPDEAAANGAWASKSKRFSYLAPLGKSVQKAEVNGKTVFRLRVNAGSAGAASELCGKLRVAGEACFVAKD